MVKFEKVVMGVGVIMATLGTAAQAQVEAVILSNHIKSDTLTETELVESKAALKKAHKEFLEASKDLSPEEVKGAIAKAQDTVDNVMSEAQVQELLNDLLSRAQTASVDDVVAGYSPAATSTNNPAQSNVAVQSSPELWNFIADLQALYDGSKSDAQKQQEFDRQLDLFTEQNPVLAASVQQNYIQSGVRAGGLTMFEWLANAGGRNGISTTQIENISNQVAGARSGYISQEALIIQGLLREREMSRLEVKGLTTGRIHWQTYNGTDNLFLNKPDVPEEPKPPKWLAGALGELGETSKGAISSFFGGLLRGGVDEGLESAGRTFEKGGQGSVNNVIAGWNQKRQQEFRLYETQRREYEAALASRRQWADSNLREASRKLPKLDQEIQELRDQLIEFDPSGNLIKGAMQDARNNLKERYPDIDIDDLGFGSVEQKSVEKQALDAAIEFRIGDETVSKEEYASHVDAQEKQTAKENKAEQRNKWQNHVKNVTGTIDVTKGRC